MFRLDQFNHLRHVKYHTHTFLGKQKSQRNLFSVKFCLKKLNTQAEAWSAQRDRFKQIFSKEKNHDLGEFKNRQTLTCSKPGFVVCSFVLASFFLVPIVAPLIHSVTNMLFPVKHLLWIMTCVGLHFHHQSLLNSYPFLVLTFVVQRHVRRGARAVALCWILWVRGPAILSW